MLSDVAGPLDRRDMSVQRGEPAAGGGRLHAAARSTGDLSPAAGGLQVTVGIVGRVLGRGVPAKQVSHGPQGTCPCGPREFRQAATARRLRGLDGLRRQFQLVREFSQALRRRGDAGLPQGLAGACSGTEPGQDGIQLIAGLPRLPGAAGAVPDPRLASPAAISAMAVASSRRASCSRSSGMRQDVPATSAASCQRPARWRTSIISSAGHG